MQQIDISPYPDQEFTIVLDGETVRVHIVWVGNCSSWFMGIEGVSFSLSLAPMRICVNRFLLDGLAIREIGELVLLDLEDKEQEPNYNDFGSRWVLVYYTKDEMGYDII